jgi:hypothetical protein
VPSLHACRSTLEDPHTKHQGKFQRVETGGKDSRGFDYQDLDGDGTIELVSKDQSFYYAFSAYAFSFPPSQIFSLKEGKLVDGYRARIRNHGHSCFLCEIVIRSQFHTTYEPEA